MTPNRTLAETLYDRLQGIGVNPGRSNKLTMFAVIKETVAAEADIIERVNAENARLAAELAQAKQDWLEQVNDTAHALVQEKADVAKLREALRTAPMPYRESKLKGEVWDEAYDEWWHKSVSEHPGSTSVLAKTAPK